MLRHLSLVALVACASPAPHVSLPSLKFPLTSYDCSTLELTVELRFVRLSDSKTVLTTQSNGTTPTFDLSFDKLAQGSYRLEVDFKSGDTVVASTSKEVTLIGGKGNTLSITFDAPGAVSVTDSDGDGFFDCEELLAGSDSTSRISVPSPATEKEAPTFEGSLSADATGSDRLRISWEAAQDRHASALRLPLRYFVFWSTTPKQNLKGRDFAACSIDTECQRTPPDASGVDILGLDPLRTYYVKVAVQDAAGNITVNNDGTDEVEVDATTLLDNRPARFDALSSYTASCKVPPVPDANGFQDFSKMTNSTRQVCASGSSIPGCTVSPVPSLDRIDIDEGDKLVLTITARDGETLFCNPVDRADTALCARITDPVKESVRSQKRPVGLSLNLAPFAENEIKCERFLATSACNSDQQCTVNPSLAGCYKTWDCAIGTDGVTTCTITYIPDESAGGTQAGESKPYLVEVSADDDLDGQDLQTTLFQITVRNRDLPPTYAFPAPPLTCSSLSVPETLSFDVVRGIKNTIPLTSAVDTDGDAIQFQFGPLPNGITLTPQAAPVAGKPAETIMTVVPGIDMPTQTVLTARVYQTLNPANFTDIRILLRVRETVSGTIDARVASTAPTGCSANGFVSASCACATEPTVYADTGLQGPSGQMGALVAAGGTGSDKLVFAALDGNDGFVYSAQMTSSATFGITLTPPPLAPTGEASALAEPVLSPRPTLLSVVGNQTKPPAIASGRLNANGTDDVVAAVQGGAGQTVLRFLPDGGAADPTPWRTLLPADLGGATRVVAMTVIDVDSDGAQDVVMAAHSGAQQPIKMFVARLAAPVAATGRPTFVAESPRQIAAALPTANRFAGMALASVNGVKELWIAEYTSGSVPPGTLTTITVSVFALDANLVATRTITRTFDRQVRKGRDLLPPGIGLHDFNGDGVSDFWTSDASTTDCFATNCAARLLVALREVAPQARNGGSCPIAGADPCVKAADALSTLSASRLPLGHPTGSSGYSLLADGGNSALLRFADGTPVWATVVDRAIESPPVGSGADDPGYRFTLRKLVVAQRKSSSSAWAAANPSKKVDSTIKEQGVGSSRPVLSAVVEQLLTSDLDADGRSDTQLRVGANGGVGTIRLVQPVCQPRGTGLPGSNAMIANTTSEASTVLRATAASSLAPDTTPLVIAVHNSAGNVPAWHTGVTTFDASTGNLSPFNAGLSAYSPLSVVDPAVASPGLGTALVKMHLDDLDADGYPDMMLSHAFGDETGAGGKLIYAKGGAGGLGVSFSTPVVLPPGEPGILASAVLDLNRDSVADFVEIPYDRVAIDARFGSRTSAGLSFDASPVRVLTALDTNAKAIYSSGPFSLRGQALVHGDFDGDGLEDLATVVRHPTAPRGALAIAYGNKQNQGSDYFEAETRVDLPAPTGAVSDAIAASSSDDLVSHAVYHLVSTDLNGDSFADFVIAASVEPDIGSAAVNACLPTDSCDALNVQRVETFLWVVMGKGGDPTQASREYTTTPYVIPLLTSLTTMSVVDRDGDNVPDIALQGWSCRRIDSLGCFHGANGDRGMVSVSFSRP